MLRVLYFRTVGCPIVIFLESKKGHGRGREQSVSVQRNPVIVLESPCGTGEEGYDCYFQWRGSLARRHPRKSLFVRIVDHHWPWAWPLRKAMHDR